MTDGFPERQDLRARIVVAAGLFLLIFVTARFPGEPSREQVVAWLSDNRLYESILKEMTAWIRSMGL